MPLVWTNRTVLQSAPPPPQVIRGLRQSRGCLVENQQQFEFCHRVLEEVVWGRVEGEDEEDGAKKEGRGRKWKLFRRRKNNGEL